MVMMIMMGVHHTVVLTINHALHVTELLHVAWDSDGTLLLKPIFFLSFLKEFQEQRMVNIHNWNHKPFKFLFSFVAHQNCHAPLWYTLDLVLMMMVVMMMMMEEEMREVEEIEVHMLPFTTTHCKININYLFQPKNKHKIRFGF